MQYFLCYSSFTTDAPFDASLFVEFSKKLGHNGINAINEKIVSLKTHLEAPKKDTKSSDPTELIDKKNDEPGPQIRG